MASDQCQSTNMCQWREDLGCSPPGTSRQRPTFRSHLFHHVSIYTYFIMLNIYPFHHVSAYSNFITSQNIHILSYRIYLFLYISEDSYFILYKNLSISSCIRIIKVSLGACTCNFQFTQDNLHTTHSFMISIMYNS